MQKEAEFWKSIGNDIQCELCPNKCFIPQDTEGLCRNRRNEKGKLISLSHSKVSSLSQENIEKSLYHFMPGKKVLSLRSKGCNFCCKNCKKQEKTLEISPEEVVKHAKNNIISFSDPEPTTFYEYMKDISNLARDKDIKNILISNGYINQEPLKKLINNLDAAKIDIKAFDEDYYKMLGGKLSPVLETIKTLKNNVWLEISNELIPGVNDSYEKINLLIDWIKNNLGSDIPLHFLTYTPINVNMPKTSKETLKKARNIAISKGIKYVYTEDDKSTYCPKCKNELIKRKSFNIQENKIKHGKCPYCKESISGVW